MQKAGAFLLLIITFLACKKETSNGIIDDWKVNSMLERGDTLTIFPTRKLELHFNSNKTVELFSDSLNCTSNYDIESGEIIIDSLSCSSTSSDMFEKKMSRLLHKINNFDVQGNTAFLYGDNQLTIKLLKE